VREQPALALDAAAVAGETAVGADDAMARHDDPDRVVTVRESNRARCVRRTDATRQFAIRRGGAELHIEQRAPHGALKVRTARRQRQIEVAQFAHEVRIELLYDRLEWPRIAFPFLLHFARVLLRLHVQAGQRLAVADQQQFA